MANLTCENCEAEILDGASFCTRCAKPVSVAQLGPVYVPHQPEIVFPVEAQIVPAVAQPKYAGFWLRAAAYVIDTVLVSVALALLASFSPAPFIILPNSDVVSLATLPHLTPLAIAIMLPTVWLYYALFESSSWQATPGKRVLGLYVTDLRGRPVTFARATVRYFTKIISSLTFLVGYVLAGFTAKKQALHDIIANCLVLRRR